METIRNMLVLIALAAALTVASGDDPTSADTPTLPPPGTYRKGETLYRRRTIAGTGVKGYQDGPSLGTMIMHGNPDADDEGNVYWMERGGFAVIRKYDPETKRVTTFAGSSNGYLDGPCEVARFSSGSYMATDYLRVSPDGKWIYVADPGNGGLLRKIDVQKRIVSTVDPNKIRRMTGFDTDSKGNCFVSASNTIWEVSPDGTIKKYDVEARPGSNKDISGGNRSAYRLAIDEKNNRVYCMVREKSHRFWTWDLDTGKWSPLFNPMFNDFYKANKDKRVPLWHSAMADTMSVRCPSGISLRGGEEGKIFYWGGGDDRTFYRFNLAGRFSEGFMPVDPKTGKQTQKAGGYYAFGASKPVRAQGAVCTWAGAPRWDGKGNMYANWSIWPRIIMFYPVESEATE